MQVVVATVGKLKEKFWREAQAEYVKRLSAYARLDIVEVDHATTPAKPSDAEIEAAVQAEAARLSGVLRDRDGVIALDRTGHAYSSEAWANEYRRLMGEGFGRLVFFVGGSHGLAPELLQRSACKWSFGPATFPHELARIMLLEQIYRGERILRGEPYHK